MREFASFESRNRRTGLKEQACVPGSETVSPQMQFTTTARIPEFFLVFGRSQPRPASAEGCWGEGGKVGGFRVQGLAAACCGIQAWAKLKFHLGWSAWTRPPTMGGGGLAREVKGE